MNSGYRYLTKKKLKNKNKTHKKKVEVTNSYRAKENENMGYLAIGCITRVMNPTKDINQIQISK